MRHSLKTTQLVFSLILLNISILTAQRHTISGHITDESNGETLISASVIDKLAEKGTVSNNYGYYSITLPAGNVALQYSYVGFNPRIIEFNLTKDTVINVKLDSNVSLKEVTVFGQRNELGVQGSQMSAIEVPIEQIKNIPSLLGENDLIKALQLLPGVQSGTEGSAGLYVRGGGPDQNLMLLDGIPIYNVNHMFGFFSAFNSDALKNVTLYKGSFPARFGGRLSSVVDVRMKDGDDKNYHGNVSVGLIASRFNVEGPIWKEKTTFNVSARRTYMDILSQPLIRAYAARENEGDMSKTTAGYYFYDLNAKITHKFSDRNKLFLSTYLGDDAIYTRFRTSHNMRDDNESSQWMSLNWDWGNAITALRWNHVVTNKLFMNTTAAFTRYRSHMNVGYNSEQTDKTENPPRKTEQKLKVGYRSGITDYTLKVDFDYSPNTSHDVKFGVNYTYHTFRPDVTTFFASNNMEGQDFKLDTVIGKGNIYSHETMTYVEDNISVTDWLKVNAGLHFSTFNVQKKNYFSLEPRLGLRILANDNLSFKAGYASMNQYIHLLSNNSISMPTDLWVPATKRIKPMNSQQYAAGVFYKLKDIADFSLEGYYKSMHNLIEYKDGASFMGESTGWEEKVVMGEGWSYGVEFFAQRSFGNTTGWVGYTWSKTERLFDRPGQELNNSQVFPAKYDRRHDFSVTATHKFSEKIDVSATWVFATGNTATLGMQLYQRPEIPHEAQQNGDESNRLTHISSRNNYRFDNYHRADIGVNFHKKKKHGTRTWNISIYNAYNQLNPFMVFRSANQKYNPATERFEENVVFKQVTLFPIIPSVSYSYKF
ncbi:MAG: TonB-dependent receptor [Porphyromonadaceae bacterium]|nr:TonB-dependent receptor [Porphyromonadaceae bacterium]